MGVIDSGLLEKLKALPPHRVAEVEDFIDFLRTREEDRAIASSAAKASERAFAEVWDNELDAAYDRM